MTSLPNGEPVAVVENVIFESRHDRPSCVLVRRGLLGWPVDGVGVEDIEEIVPSAERLRLKCSG
ncbi:MAG: hypothetical protein ACXVRS_15370 [Gaiellaceae bacterium]